ncbi:MAG: glycosyltransferase family 4 protein [Muribaculum sp.]|nr:glycosyltransferase family 4 protein [Muribaculum sp.]
MKIVVIGTRGIPEIQGGVETHCQELYPRIAAMGHDVTVIRRTPYVTDANRTALYRGVKLVDVYAPKSKSAEAIVHTFLAVIKARRLHPDILHIHAVGPALLTPLARILGMKVVWTNHGPDYDRQKWGQLAKTALRMGERMGAKFCSRPIVISKLIAGILADKYGRRDSALIYNGVNSPAEVSATDFLEKHGIRPGKYILAMGRLVEEKGFHDLVKAYSQWPMKDKFQLVITGDADHEDDYSRRLKRTATSAGAVLTGFIRGEALEQILANAALFVMPSYHEGLPIALLEAMSYRLDVAVSDIPANRLDILSPDDFFPVGNTEALVRILSRKLSEQHTRQQNEAGNFIPYRRIYDLSAYNWDNIAAQTSALYTSLI